MGVIGGFPGPSGGGICCFLGHYWGVLIGFPGVIWGLLGAVLCLWGGGWLFSWAAWVCSLLFSWAFWGGYWLFCCNILGVIGGFHWFLGWGSLLFYCAVLVLFCCFSWALLFFLFSFNNLGVIVGFHLFLCIVICCFIGHYGGGYLVVFLGILGIVICGFHLVI